MSRLALRFLAIVVLLSTGVPLARAQAPTDTGLRTIESPEGYQFQVPSDWIQIPSAALPRSLDMQVVSPDHGQTATARVAIENIAGVTAADLPSLAGRYITGTIQNSQSLGLGAPSVFQGPEPVDVSNADAAIAFVSAGTDAQGARDITSTRMALRGQTVYLFALSATEDYYRSDPNFARILNSFQLTAPAQPSPAANTTAGTPNFGLSPEEALVSLLPYQLRPEETPEGYTIGPAVRPNTPATFAARSSSPAADFTARKRAGFVVDEGQRLMPSIQPAIIPGATWFYTWLFSDTTGANGYATGKTLAPAGNSDFVFERVSLGISLGEASIAWHVSATAPDQPAEGYYLVKWQRGQLAFELDTEPRPLGQEQQADAERLAAALDKIERTRPAYLLPTQTVTPPATEPQRLQAALQLKPFFVAADAAPDGYSLGSSYIDHPAGEVQNEPDPVAALHRVDEQWKEIVGARQFFVNKQNSDLTLGASAVLCADPQAALVDMGDEIAGPGWTSARTDAPVQLGDATLAFRDTGTSVDGAARESISIGWTHGALLLEVDMDGPTGSTSLDQLAAVARQVEARFQATPLPTTGVPPSGAILASDDFANPDAGIFLKASTLVGLQVGYVDGEYQVAKIDPALHGGPYAAAPGIYADVVLRVDAHLVGPTAGRWIDVGCRVSGLDTGYDFLVFPFTGAAGLVRSDTGVPVLLAQVESSGAIRSGNETNHLELRCSGSTISARVNGIELFSVQDSAYQIGQAYLGSGVRDEALPGTVEARFSDFVLAQP